MASIVSSRRRAPAALRASDIRRGSFGTPRGGAVLALGVAAALTASLATPAWADDGDHLEDRRSTVTGRIDSAGVLVQESSKELTAATRVLERAQARLAAAQDRLAVTRGELATAVEYDALMQQRLVDAEARLASAEAELAQGQRSVATAEDRLTEFVVSSAQYGDPGVVAMDTLLDGDDPTELSQGIALTDSVLGVQVTSIDDLEAAKTLLALRAGEVQAIRDEVDLSREQAAANLVRKQGLEQRASVEALAVQGLVARHAAALREAARARRADLAQLRALEAERDQISQRLRRIAARSTMPSIDIAARSAMPSISADGNGYLSAPVSAPITSPYGMRMHPVLHVLKLHDGTDFGVGCGTPVRAAAAGDVVSAAYSEGYGNQLVVDDGTVNDRGLATSYSHLTRFAASPGEHVERGEVVAYSGNTGYSTGCHLHFMVYVDGNPVDPMGWL